jgi:hypothetical protein
MEKRHFLVATFLLGLLVLCTLRTTGQEDQTRLHVVVNLVQLNVAVTDNKGNYVTGLHPSDFVITEDSIPENIATFEEGNGPTTRLVDITADVDKNGANESASAPLISFALWKMRTKSLSIPTAATCSGPQP